MISLDGIQLPEDLFWSDEFDFTPMGQTRTETLGNAVIIEEPSGALVGGRPITLIGGDDFAWIQRSVLEQLRAKLPQVLDMALGLNDGRTFSVRWRHADKPIEAEPVVHYANPIGADFYIPRLRLITTS